MGATALDVLGDAEYVLLTTFRRDGTPVSTPVWVVRVGDELRVWSNPAAGKVKRIRRSGAVTVVPCSTRGRPRGAAIAGTARVLPDDDVPPLLDALAGKYGLIGRLTVSRVRSGRRPGSAIAVRVGEPAVESARESARDSAPDSGLDSALE